MLLCAIISVASARSVEFARLESAAGPRFSDDIRILGPPDVYVLPVKVVYVKLVSIQTGWLTKPISVAG